MRDADVRPTADCGRGTSDFDPLPTAEEEMGISTHCGLRRRKWGFRLNAEYGGEVLEIGEVVAAANEWRTSGYDGAFRHSRRHRAAMTTPTIPARFRARGDRVVRHNPIRNRRSRHRPASDADSSAPHHAHDPETQPLRVGALSTIGSGKETVPQKTLTSVRSPKASIPLTSHV